jgi:CelD/BcsL family acetyltransferase involved in cellulose biosynthesis
MQVVRITSESELEQLRPQWNRLAGGVPFRMWQWLHGWWRHYGDGRDLYVLAVYDGDQVLRGVAPWMRETSVQHGRAIRGLGTGEVCSDYLSVLTEEKHTDPVAAALAQWLTGTARDRPTSGVDHRWDLLELTGVDAEDNATQRLIGHLRRCGHAVYCRQDFDFWSIKLPATWDEYLAGLSKSHRKKIRRLERNELGGDHVGVRWTSSPDEIQAGMKVLVDLHQRRRQALGDSGCFSSERFSRFLHEAAVCLAADDRLKLYWVEWRGDPVAAEFQLVGDDTVYAYQSGLNPEQLDLQPGRLSCIVGIQRAIAEGRRQFDFLRGDEPYKAQWRAERRPSLFARVVPRKPLALARQFTWLAGRRAKETIKEGLVALGMRSAAEPVRERARPVGTEP